MTKITDCRLQSESDPRIRDMRNGTWFLGGGRLKLKASSAFVVDAETGMQTDFNEEHRGTVVGVEVRIIQ